MEGKKADAELFARAAELRDQEEYEASLVILEQLIDRRNTSAAVLAVAGHVCWELERLPEAEVYFEKAVSLSPKNTASSLGLFHTRWEQGKESEALDEVKRFTDLTGSNEYMEIVGEINEKWRSTQ